MEFKLWALLLLIADRGGFRRPRPGTTGWVLDAGANDGDTAVMLANALRSLRLNVLAIEPLANNVRGGACERRERMSNRGGAAGRPWAPSTAARGTTRSTSTICQRRPGGADFSRSGAAALWARATYPVVTIDALFDAKRRVARSCWRTWTSKGREPDALRGGNATLRRDRPVVTVENLPQVDAAPAPETVMAQLEALRYDVYTVEESVGTIRDGRNTVAIPREDGHLRRIVEHYFATP